MRLFKNVDICDLSSILDKGIISIDEGGKDNWEDGRRADNPTDVVYLFQPISGKSNAFPNYGVALLEVNIDDAELSSLEDSDAHKEDYIEYTAQKVEPEDIKAIYIPSIFKTRLYDMPEDIKDRITWCGMSAEAYGKEELEKASEKTLQEFAETAAIKDSTVFNFFRGTRGRAVFDLYNIIYEI